QSNNVDLSLRKFDGDVGFIVNAFYNAIDDYYYLTDTGLEVAGHHHHIDDNRPDENHAQVDGEDSLPVYMYQAQDVRLYGVEGQWMWQLSDPLKITLTSDYIRAQLTSGENLPRIPPMRVGALMNYQ